jgi:hypothetical protein
MKVSCIIKGVPGSGDITKAPKLIEETGLKNILNKNIELSHIRIQLGSTEDNKNIVNFNKARYIAITVEKYQPPNVSVESRRRRRRGHSANYSAEQQYFIRCTGLHLFQKDHLCKKKNAAACIEVALVLRHKVFHLPREHHNLNHPTSNFKNNNQSEGASRKLSTILASQQGQNSRSCQTASFNQNYEHPTMK